MGVESATTLERGRAEFRTPSRVRVVKIPLP